MSAAFDVSRTCAVDQGRDEDDAHHGAGRAACGSFAPDMHPTTGSRVFLKSYTTNETCQRVVPISRSRLAAFLAWLRSQNAAGWNIYCSVNAVRPNGRSRARAAIAAVRHVFLEADHEGPQFLASLARRDRSSAAVVRPAHVPEPRHVFWRVTGFDIAQVEVLQKQLARELQADTAATSCSQTTRLPGFLNHKRTAS